jgi:hypothetical protein
MMRVRQSGHSRDEDIMRSEQLRHIAKWLAKKKNVNRVERNSTPETNHAPAIDNGDVGLFVLADNAQSVSLEIDSGPHRSWWWHFIIRLVGNGRVRIPITFSLSTCLLFLESLFLHHRVLTSNNLFFASMYRSLSRAFLTLIAEKSVHAFDKVALLKQQTRIYMVLE